MGELISSHPWIRHLLDVSIVSVIIYRMLLLVRGTRAVPMLWGLTLLVLLYLIAVPLGLVTLAWLLNSFLSAIILVVVILFQDELRRGLTKVGLQPLLRKNNDTVQRTIEDVSLVATKLAKDRVGALIVIKRNVGLDEFVEDAVILDARLNRKLLTAIFLPQSPLHDGAVVVEGDRIKAAGCLLPLSFDPDLDPNLGTRHRAALGISERSDAIVIVVSEQSGAISLAREGRLVRNLDAALLRDSLHRFLAASESRGTVGGAA
jgi:diadenylate cyclase